MPHALPLAAYADLISLGVPCETYQPVTGAAWLSALRSAATWLLSEAGRRVALPHDDAALRVLIKRLLTVRHPQPLPVDISASLNAILAGDAAQRSLVTVDDLAECRIGFVGSTAIALWQGDITRLGVDALSTLLTPASWVVFSPTTRASIT